MKNGVRTALAVSMGRLAGTCSRRMKLGAGTSVSGYVARKIEPNILKNLTKQLTEGCITVSGTNGKTTTSAMLAYILKAAGNRVWRNREGANLRNGIIGSLILRASLHGSLRWQGNALAIFETDEGATPFVFEQTQPRICTFTNLFRDQLDRYGEVESVLATWRKAIASLPQQSTLILNADDPSVASLGEERSQKSIYFGINLPETKNNSESHQTQDARICWRCGAAYHYAWKTFSHLGEYACPQCGWHRPTPTMYATNVQEQRDGTSFVLHTPSEVSTLFLPLKGIYNVYNALAACTTAYIAQAPIESMKQGLQRVKPAFGRGERCTIEQRTVELCLAKNPTGWNEALRAYAEQEKLAYTLLGLSDRSADGEDVSWIWDIAFEEYKDIMEKVVVTGTRAFDLALRLKYAHVPEEKMIVIPTQKIRNAVPVYTVHGMDQALLTAVHQTPEQAHLNCFLTYTTLMDLHYVLEQKHLVPKYWEGRDI